MLLFQEMEREFIFNKPVSETKKQKVYVERSNIIKLGEHVEKEDIRIKQAIIHILDSSVIVPVLSDVELDLDSEVNEFIRSHVYKVISGDDYKECFFEDEETYVLTQLKTFNSEAFVEMSKNLATSLFEIMQKNVEIPSADLIVSNFEVYDKDYIALLKMNYKSAYIHYVESIESDTVNSIIRQKSALPSEMQRLDEAIIIDLSDYSIRLIEKKYPVNGQKENYLSLYYLHCSGNSSAKTKLSVIAKTVDQINKKYYNDDYERKLEVKKVILDEYAETGSIVVDTIADKIFENQIEIKEEFKEIISKHGFNDEPVSFQTKGATKKIEKQVIKTDTGIEINIPVEQYGNKDVLEFVTNANGTISVIIKNIYNAQL